MILLLLGVFEQVIQQQRNAPEPLNGTNEELTKGLSSALTATLADLKKNTIHPKFNFFLANREMGRVRTLRKAWKRGLVLSHSSSVFFMFSKKLTKGG